MRTGFFSGVDNGVARYYAAQHGKLTLRKARRQGQDPPDQAHRRGACARRQVVDCLGRPSHRLRRARSALWHQVLHRQLPPRRACGGARRADVGRGIRYLHEGQSEPGGQHRQALPPEPAGQSRGLAEAPARQHHPAGCGGPVQSHQRQAWLGGGQPDALNAALDLPPALRRPREPAQSRRTVAGGRGRFNRMRRRISSPAEVLPRWRARVDSVDLDPAIRDIFLIGLYTGMRMGEVVSLRWERLDLDRTFSGSRRPRPGSRLSFRSPGSSPRSSSVAGRMPTSRTWSPRAGSFRPPRRPRRVTSRTFRSSIPILARPGEPASGSTACATPSSRWPNVNSCCRVR